MDPPNEGPSKSGLWLSFCSFSSLLPMKQQSCRQLPLPKICVSSIRRSSSHEMLDLDACFSFKNQVFLNPWFGEPVFCALGSRGFRHFCGFLNIRQSCTELLVCSCLTCLHRFRDFRRFRERRPACKPWVWQTIPKGPKIENTQSRLKMLNLASKFLSRLKISILIFRTSHEI